MALAFHWWPEDFFKGTTLNSFWYDVVLAVNLIQMLANVWFSNRADLMCNWLMGLILGLWNNGVCCCLHLHVMISKCCLLVQ